METTTFEKITDGIEPDWAGPEVRERPTIEAAVDRCRERSHAGAVEFTDEDGVHQVREWARCARLSATTAGIHSVGRNACRLCQVNGGPVAANPYLQQAALHVAFQRVVRHVEDERSFPTKEADIDAAMVTAKGFVSDALAVRLLNTAISMRTKCLLVSDSPGAAVDVDKVARILQRHKLVDAALRSLQK